MIHNVQIDNGIYLDLVKAADAAGMTIEQFEAWAISDAVTTYRGRQNARREFVQALEDAYGVIPGGD